MASRRRVQLLIRGRVQGVFFRNHARSAARRLRIAGWVRNESDGSVQAIAEGSADDLEQFIAWCRRGSPSARVERVEIAELHGSDTSLPEPFEVHR